MLGAVMVHGVERCLASCFHHVWRLHHMPFSHHISHAGQLSVNSLARTLARISTAEPVASDFGHGLVGGNDAITLAHTLEDCLV